MTPPRTPDTPFESLLESAPPDPADPPASTTGAEEFVKQIHDIADKLIKDGVTRADAKLLAAALKELRYCFKVFGEYRGRRKVTIFGSARTRPDHPAYQSAVEFGRRMAETGYMVITGAAAGIMEAGMVGAGAEHSFGLNILLPFESGANPVILSDPKLMNLRYFFTRKLVFIKESDAVALFPGGFGTHDEAFETLTLIQTGKSHIFPLVLVDEPGGNYWERWRAFVEEDMMARGYTSPEDRAFYHITDSVEEAVEEVTGFYRQYHSMRYVRGSLVLRMQQVPTAATLAKVERDFADIAADGFEVCGALPQEANEPALADLPRLRFRFDRQRQGRLRQLIDLLNEDA